MQFRSWSNLKNRAIAMVRRRWKESPTDLALPRVLALEDRVLFDADPFADPSATIAAVDEGLIFADLFARIDDLTTLSHSGIPFMTIEDMRDAAQDTHGDNDAVLATATSDHAAILDQASELNVLLALQHQDPAVDSPTLINAPSTVPGTSIVGTVHEVVFVSDDISHYQDLISEIAQNGGTSRDVIVVAAGSEGLAQISDALKNYRDLQAIHIVSHGGEQGLLLGGTWLGSESGSVHASQIAAWGQALSAEGDLLLYGCEVAEGTAGREFLQWLGESTQADIAASTDLTGSSTLGGNWVLEYHVGQIETAAILGDHSNLQWHGVLATVTVTTGSDNFDGNITSIANLIASPGSDGAISLREAITAANNTPGADTINWSQGSGAKSSSLASALPFITDSVTIDATTQPGYTGAPLITLNGAIAGGGTSGFVVQANDVVIKGFVIHSFGADGIRIESGTNALIENNRIGTSPNGSSDFGNGGDGIQINTANNTVRNNLISGNNAYGIFLSGGGASGNTIVGNLIGTSANGSADLGNSLSGIRISGGSGNIIGGAGASLGNTISGNNNSGIELFSGATGNQILGNYLGTNSAGTADLGNSLDGIYLDGSSGNTIGAPGAGNVISGNNIHGIRLLNSSSGNTIQSNIVGLDATGTLDLGNTYNGIYVASGSSTNTIGGIGAGNIVSGNNDTGIEIQDSSSTGNFIRGNYVGTNAAGTAAIGNLDGIIIEDAPGNTIGGLLPGQGNLISGNSGGAGTGNGVIIFGSNAIGNLVQGNTIGANATRTAAIANTGHGVWISDRGDSGTIKGSAQNNTVGGAVAGAGNYIAHNGLDGIAVTSSAATGNSLRRNTIFSNGGLAIDLGDNGVTNNDGGDGDPGPNLQQNFPTIGSAKSNGSELRITGSLNSTAASTFNIDFYWSTVADGSAHGEAQNYAGSTTVVTNGSGNASFSVTFSGNVPAGAIVSATATSATGNTSEFGLNATSIAALGISYPGSPLTWTADDGPTVIDPSAALNNPQSLAWTGGNLTVNFSSGGTLTDVLSVYGPGTAGTLSVVSGTNVRFHPGGAPVTFATLAGGTAGAPLVVTFNANATDAMVQTLLRSIEYSNSGSPPISSRTVQFVLTSGGGETSNPESETINVGPANNAPGINIGNVALSYTENGPAVVIDSAINLSDTDSPNLAQAVIRISANFAAGQDVLTYNSALATSFGINGNYNATTGELTLSGSSSVANYEQVLETVAYLNSSENPSTAVRTIEFTISDGFDTGSDSRNVNIVPANDAPNLDLDADNSLATGLNATGNFIAGQGAVLIVDNDAFTSDVDNATWQSITVTITNRLDGVAEVLSANTGGTSLTANYNAGSGMLTISGVGTIAEYQQVLRTVTYNNSAANPNTTPRLIDFVANDGTDDSLAARSTVYIQAAGGLYLTTEDDVVASGAPGLANWQKSDVLKFGGPGLTLGTNTAGTFSLEAAMSAFGGSKNVNAIDFISRDIQIGGQSFAPMQLEYGDLLLSLKSSDSFTGSDAQTIFVTKDDVFVFRPDTPGDYSSGRFIFLLNDLAQGTDVVSIVLVEQDTLVGDVIVGAGTFLYSQGSGGGQTIFAFKASDVGRFTTAGTRQILIDGTQIGINEGIVGLDLVENTTSIGGQTLAEGNLIVSVDSAEPVGGGAGLAVTAHDMFVLNVTATTLGSGNAAATATMFFEGTDVGLSTLLTEELSGLALITSEGAPTIVTSPSNNAPAVNDQTFATAENTVNGSIVGTVVASDSDAGANGTLTYSVTGGSGLTAFAVDPSTGAITVADAAQLDYETTTTLTLDVLVTDGGAPGLSDTATITINLNDVNEAPTNLLPATANVNEGTNTSGGLSVAVLTTTDPDAGDTFTYSILPGGDSVNFSIGGAGSNELILTAGVLDFETKSSYSVTVRTTDSAGNTFDKLFTVNVNDLTEGGQLWFTTAGNGNTGTTTWDNNDIIKFTDPNLKYEPVDGTTLGTHALLPGFNAPNPVRGLHYVQTNITIGTIPGRTFDLQAGDLLVTLDPGGGTATVNGITYDRKDILVYRPTSPGSYATGTYFMLLDDGIHDASTSYNSHAIHLVEHNTVVGGTTLSRGTLLVARSTPADHDNLYIFNVNGTGVGINTSTTNMQLLMDGDNLGLADQMIQGLHLVEQTTVVGSTTLNVGTLLLNVRNSVALNVTGTISPNSEDIFSLVLSSTELVAPGSTAGVAALFYDGSDVGMTSGPPGNVAESINSITLIPVTANTPPSDIAPNILSVPELTDTTAGFSLGVLTTTDPDSFDTFTYSILPGGDGARFSIGGANSDELILTHGVLNYEAQSSYSVLVRVTDSAGNSWQETLTVNVVDLNEMPVINNQTFGINENSANGTPVGTVVASDQDSGANGALTYTITGGSGATAFAINSATGEITVADASQLNFEATTSFSLQIQVSDGGAPNLSSTATITINLNNVNEAPSDLTPVSFSLNEGTDTTSGLALGTLATVDPDAGETFTYTIRPGGDAANFSISGIGNDELVLSAGVLNFESKNVYTATVRSTDSAGNIIERLVTVNIVDLNELPVINNQSFGINENSANGTSVGTVNATDQDSGANGTLTYAITGGTGATAFAINPTTGEITVADASQLDFETTTSFTLTVQASDSGAPALSATATVTINVLDVNESPTDIAPNSMTFPENTITTGGLSVGVLTATDVDAAETFAYTILPGGDATKFSIGGAGSNELILTDGILNFETKSSYNVTVRVTDSAGNFYDETLTVNVSDLNETPAIGNQSFAIVENRPNGTVVGTVIASDPDSGVNGTLTYSIVGGTGATAFTIDSASGQITVADQSQLDFETNPSFSLQVQVTDGGTPGLNAVATITINLLDGNETPTDILPNGFTVVENTDTTGGLSLGILTAVDPDPSDTFTYSIRPGLDGVLFSIGGVGADELILTDGVIDFERQSSYSVTIRLTDSAGNFYDETLTINVVDINEDPVADAGGPYTMNEGSGIALDGTGSSDPEGSPLTYRWDLDNDGTYGDVVGATPMLGWGSLNLWGITNQGVHTIGLQVSDAAGNTHATTTTLTVNNLAPTAGNDSGLGFEADEDSSFITGDVLTNDSDPNSNDILTVGGLDLTGTLGLVVDNGDGTFTYDPNGQFENLNVGDTAFDSFNYFVQDETGASVVGTVTVTIYGVNDEQQLAVNNALTVNEGSAATIAASELSTTDVDNSASETVYSVTRATAFGRLELVAAPGIAISSFTQDQLDSGLVRYVHNGSEASGDSFDFSVDDGRGLASLGTFTINVNPMNDAPSAGNDNVSTTQGLSLTIERAIILANDWDVDSGNLTIQIVLGPSHGTLISNPDGSYSYQPTATYFGTDEFHYRLSDGSATSNLAKVTVQVVAAGVAPTTPTTVVTPSPKNDPAPAPNALPPVASAATDGSSGGTAEGKSELIEQPTRRHFSQLSENMIASTRIEDEINGDGYSWTKVFASAGSRESDGEITGALAASDMRFVTQAGLFWNALDGFKRQAEEFVGLPLFVTGGATALTTSISVGYVVWMIRGGQVLAALMAHLPAWSLIDPLPILGAIEKREDDQDDSLQSMLDEPSTAEAPASAEPGKTTVATENTAGV